MPKKTTTGKRFAKKEDLLLETRWNSKGQPLLRAVSGALNEPTMIELGFGYYTPKPSDENTDEYWWVQHPTNTQHIENLKRVIEFRTKGAVKVDIRLWDTNGDRAEDVLLPEVPPTMAPRFQALFGRNKFVQADEDTHELMMKLIERYHPHLAGTAILLTVEDYTPEDLAEKMGRGGAEVWGYAMQTNNALREYTGYDFRIALCAPVWEVLNAKSRRWLMDHELMHLGFSDGNRRFMIDHDIQMHSAEVRRYPNQAELVAQASKVISQKLFAQEQDAEQDEEAEDDS